MFIKLNFLHKLKATIMDGMILFSNPPKIKFIKLKKQSIFHVIMDSHEILQGCKIIFKNDYD